MVSGLPVSSRIQIKTARRAPSVRLIRARRLRESSTQREFAGEGWRNGAARRRARWCGGRRLNQDSKETIHARDRDLAIAPTYVYAGRSGCAFTYHGRPRSDEISG